MYFTIYDTKKLKIDSRYDSHFDNYDLVLLIHVLEVDPCLVWASLGVRLPIWVVFVVTTMSSVFFFFKERERLGVILDYLLMAMGSSF